MLMIFYFFTPAFQVMFHVATYLPYDDMDPQQIPRKKYIGNDLVTIVFIDGEGSFEPPCVSGDFLHIFGVVQPCKTDEGEGSFCFFFFVFFLLPAYTQREKKKV